MSVNRRNPAYRDWYEMSQEELRDYVGAPGLGGLSDEHTRLNLSADMFRWEFRELPVTELLRIRPESEWRSWYEGERRTRRDEDGNDDYFDQLEQEWGVEPSPIGPIVVVRIDKTLDIGDGWHRAAIAVTKKWKTVPAVVGTLKKNQIREKEIVMATRKKRQDPETAGINYATAQLESDYFMDWVREQLLEASRMDPSDVLPLETKSDARVIAKNMLQQLEWDTKRDLKETKEFFAGFHRGVTNPSTVDWLADELLELKGQMRGDVRVGRSNVNEAQRSTSSEQYVLYYSQPSGRQATLWYARRRPGDGGKDWEYTKDPNLAGVFGMRDLQRWVALHGKKAGWRVVGKTAEAPRRVRDYIAIDSHDRSVGPRHKGYSDAKRDADNAGGTVKFVPSSKRAPVREMRRPKAGRSVTHRRR